MRQRPLFQDGGHADGVGNDDAFESHFAPQKVGEDLVGQGGGVFFVKGREDGVGGHEGFGARVDARLEGGQLDLLHPLQIAPAHVQHVVRIGCRIASAGEVLDRRHNARVLIAADGCLDEFRADFRVVAERAHADFGVERIDIHVADRVIELRGADGGHLFAHDIRDLIGHIEVTDCGHPHGGRELQHAAGGVVVLEIAFHVDGDVQGNAGGPFHGDFLQLVERDREFFRGNAHAEAAVVKPGMGDIEIILRFLEVRVNLRTSPIEVLAGFQRVRFQAKAAGMQSGDLFKP